MLSVPTSECLNVCACVRKENHFEYTDQASKRSLVAQCRHMDCSQIDLTPKVSDHVPFKQGNRQNPTARECWAMRNSNMPYHQVKILTHNPKTIIVHNPPTVTKTR